VWLVLLHCEQVNQRGTYKISRALTEASEFIAEKGLLEEGAPAIVRLIARIASRLGVVVSEKAVAEAVPAVGAAGDATVNLLFINHFQSMPRGHFIIRSLERKWGGEVVKKEYGRIAEEIPKEHASPCRLQTQKIRRTQ
jgi:hypothetical protein